VSLEEFVARGRNPLLAAGGPLLSLGARVRESVHEGDVEALRREAVETVKAFEERASTLGVTADDIVIARYVLCTFVDSAVFQTPWGGQGAWGARSLLALFHREASGGEKFFQILDRVRADPSRHLDLIELLYVCLALGFEGKYRLEPDGRTRVLALQDELYRLIRDRRGASHAELSPSWQGVAEPRGKVLRLVPWWVVAVAAGAALIGTLITLRVRLSEAAAPLLASLVIRGVEAVDYAVPPETRPPSRLKELLTAQEQAGLLSVEEIGARSLVTLQVPELFRSGSASVVSEHQPLIAEIGRAMESVPGRVLVVGHTDDQPVRSFRFADNFDLSRHRAMAVAELLKPQLTDVSRVESTGVGSEQPRYEPASVPENRVRNRRVEIIHEGD